MNEGGGSEAGAAGAFGGGAFGGGPFGGSEGSDLDGGTEALYGISLITSFAFRCC